MKTATYTLNEKEVQEQKQIIAKYERLIDKELDMEDLMDLKNIEQYSKAIKNAYSLIKNGIVFENEFMAKQLN